MCQTEDFNGISNNFTFFEQSVYVCLIFILPKCFSVSFFPTAPLVLRFLFLSLLSNFLQPFVSSQWCCAAHQLVTFKNTAGT